MIGKTKYLLVFLGVCGVLYGQKLTVSPNEYNYRYPVEYDGYVIIDSIIISATSTILQFDQDNPIILHFDFDVNLNIENATVGGNAQDIYSTLTIVDNKLIVSLSDTLKNGMDIVIKNLKYIDKNIETIGYIILIDASANELDRSDYKIVVGNPSIEITQSIFPVSSEVIPINVVLSEGVETILYPTRYIYIQTTDNRIKWDLSQNLNNDNIILINVSEQTVCLSLRDTIAKNESINFQLNILSSPTAIKDVRLKMSVLDNSNQNYLDQTNNILGFAAPSIDLGYDQIFIPGDQIDLKNIVLVNDANVDIFHIGQSFYLEIPDELSMEWNIANPIERNGIRFINDSQNRKRLIGSCLANHSPSETIIINNLPIKALANSNSNVILLRFPRSSFLYSSIRNIKIDTPILKLQIPDVYIHTDLKSRKISKITISPTSPTLFSEYRTIEISLPPQLIWDKDHLPSCNASVALKSSDSTTLLISFNSTISDSLILINGLVKIKNRVAGETQLKMQWNNNPNIFSSDKTIKIVQPLSVTFADSSWVIGDGNRILKEIRFDFSGKPFVKGYYAYIKIPSEVNASFAAINNLPSWVSQVQLLENNHVVKCNLYDSDNSFFTWVNGLVLNITGQKETFKLELSIISEPQFDTQNWYSSTTVHVKEFKLKVAYNVILLRNVENQIFANIVLRQSDDKKPSIFRSNREIELSLPSGIEWGSTLTITGALRVTGGPPNVLKLSIPSTIDSITIKNITVSSHNEMDILPTQVICSIDNNSTSFLSYENIRVGYFNVQQSDSTFIYGDSSAVVPKCTILQSQTLLLPGYAIMVKGLGITPDISYTPVIHPSSLKYRTVSGGIQFYAEDTPVSESTISIDDVQFKNFTIVGENGIVWSLVNIWSNTEIPLDTIQISVGRIAFDFVDVNATGFRYPVYIKGDTNIRPFPSIVVKDYNRVKIFRKGRRIILVLPPGILWSDGKQEYHYLIDQDKSDVDSIIISNLVVGKFQTSGNGRITCKISHNALSSEITTHNIRIITPDFDLISFFPGHGKTQVFWHNNQPTKWYLKDCIIKNVQTSGVLPGSKFGVRIKLNNKAGVSINLDSLLIFLGGNPIANPATLESGGEILHISLDKTEWDVNPVVDIQHLILTIIENFSDDTVYYSVTESPYYWLPTNLSLHAANPNVLMNSKVYLVGDNYQKVPEVNLMNFYQLPLLGNQPSLIFRFPSDLKANWGFSGPHQIVCQDSLLYNFLLPNLGTIKQVNDLIIQNIDSILTDEPITIISGEWRYAVDQNSAVRFSSGMIRVGNPHITFVQKYLEPIRFCYNDPDYIFRDIVVREDAVAALQAGDTIFIRIDQEDQEDFPAQFKALPITTFPSQIELFNDRTILIRLLNDLHANFSDTIKSLIIGNYGNNTKNTFSLKCYLRNPKEINHPMHQLAYLQVGRPQLQFSNSTSSNSYYYSHNKGLFYLDEFIQIIDDQIFPVIDTNGIVIDIFSDGNIEWDTTKNENFYWVSGNALKNLSDNLVRMTKNRFNIKTTCPWHQSDSLKIKPFYFNILDKESFAVIKISKNKGLSYLDSCYIYVTDPICTFTGSDLRILKTIKSVEIDTLCILKILGLKGGIWIEIPNDLNCDWNENDLNQIKLRTETGLKNITPTIKSNESGRKKLLHLSFNSNAQIKESIFISGLSLSIDTQAVSSYGCLKVFWDNLTLRKYYKNCDDQIIIGTPAIYLNENMTLFKDIDSEVQVPLPDLTIYDDLNPICQFISGRETFRIEIPSDKRTRIKLCGDSVNFISNGKIFNSEKLYISDDSAAIEFQIPQSFEGFSRPINFKVNGVKVLSKGIYTSPFSIKYFIKFVEDSKYYSLGQDIKKIRVANPSIKLLSEDLNTYIEPLNERITFKGKLMIKEDSVSTNLKDYTIGLFICGKCEEYKWTSDDINTDSTIRIIPFKPNQELIIDLVSIKYQFSEILNSQNLFNTFPDSITILCNFRYGQTREAIIGTELPIIVHLPVFIEPPSFNGNLLTFSVIKDYIIPKDNKYSWYDYLNYTTPNFSLIPGNNKLPFYFRPDSFNVIETGHPKITKVEYLYNDSSLYTINNYFHRLKKEEMEGEFIFLGLNIDKVALNGENEVIYQYFNWFIEKIRFNGYCPYSPTNITETNIYFNDSTYYRLEVNLDRSYNIRSIVEDLIENKIQSWESNATSTIIFKSDTLKNESLYILKITGECADNPAIKIFPIYRYLLYDNSVPYLVDNSIKPPKVTNHNLRSKNKYKGLSVTLTDTLQFVIIDNFISRTDSNGHYIIKSTPQGTITNKIPYEFNLFDSLWIKTFKKNSKKLEHELSLRLSGKEQDQTNYSLITNPCYLKFLFKDIVDTTVNRNSDYSFLIMVKDAAGNTYEDTLYYHVLFPEGEDRLLSDFIFNFPNPFKSSEGTRFRYLISDNRIIKEGKLIILDAGGDIVFYWKLTPKDLTPGEHYINWDGRSLYREILSSGIYFGYFEIEGEKPSHLKIAIDNKFK